MVKTLRKKRAFGDLVKRVVSTANPSRIVVFGSTARGEAGPHSDLDVLVVVDDGVHRGHMCEDIYRGLRGFAHPTDVVVVTESDVREYRTSPYCVIKPALDEGIEIYRRAQKKRSK